MGGRGWGRGSIAIAGNTKGGSITVPLTSCLTGLDWSVLHIKTKIVSGHTADSKQAKLEVNGTVILPPLVFPGHSVVLTTTLSINMAKHPFAFAKFAAKNACDSDSGSVCLHWMTRHK